MGRLRSLEALAALAALALGFVLVGLVVVVAFPLVSVASGGWTTLTRLFHTADDRR
jgi:hypothetical protein